MQKFFAYYKRMPESEICNTENRHNLYLSQSKNKSNHVVVKNISVDNWEVSIEGVSIAIELS